MEIPLAIGNTSSKGPVFHFHVSLPEGFEGTHLKNQPEECPWFGFGSKTWDLHQISIAKNDAWEELLNFRWVRSPIQTKTVVCHVSPGSFYRKSCEPLVSQASSCHRVGLRNLNFTWGVELLHSIVSVDSIDGKWSNIGVWSIRNMRIQYKYTIHTDPYLTSTFWGRFLTKCFLESRQSK